MRRKATSDRIAQGEPGLAVVVTVSKRKQRSRQHAAKGLALVSIQLIAELSVASLKNKVDKELCLWYELRALNYWGSGCLVINDVLDALVPALYSKSTLYRLLKAGDGLFWDLPQNGRPYLRLRGIEIVAEYLDTPRLSRPVLVPWEKWPRSRKGKRAWLYASFHRTDGDPRARPISRDSIEDATGVKRRQQIRYEEKVKVKRVANFAVRQNGDHLEPVLHQVEGKSRSWTKVRRLGNTYRSEALRGNRGMTERISRNLARSLDGDEARLPKRFFPSVKALTKCRKRGQESFFKAPPGQRCIKGRQEWVLV